MLHYADSSFLVSRYLADFNTAAALQYLQRHSCQFVFTRLHHLEVQNAFELAVFRSQLNAPAVEGARKLMIDDLKSQRLVNTGLRFSEVFHLATEFTRTHTRTTGTRTLDVLHVAAAKLLQADSFASFDKRQRQLAELAGLNVVP